MTAPMDRAGVVRVMARGLVPNGSMPIEQYPGAIEDAGLALAAIEAAGIRLVPAVETRAMFEAGRDQMTTPAIWRAMVAASPFAPKQETQG